MRALVVYCHPKEDSFNAAVRDVVLQKLDRPGTQTRLIDLYAEGFQPVLTLEEWRAYDDAPANRARVSAYCDGLKWCDTLIFVYPTWWYGMPAMLKGWLDRVMLPEVAFLMPDAENRTIRPAMQHITRMGVFTTCGASWWLMRYIGAPGKRTLLRGVGLLISPRARKVFCAHFRMDSSTDASRAAHLRRVGRQMDRLLGSRASPAPQQTEARS